MAPSEERRDSHAGTPEPHAQPAPREAAPAPRCANWISYAAAVSQQASSESVDFSSTCSL